MKNFAFIRNSLYFIFVLWLSSFFVSCTTVPPGPLTTYQQKDSSGYGYSEVKINDSTYRVSFSGNQYTDGNVAYMFFLARCAEISKDNNYSHFSVKNFEDKSTLHTTRTVVVSGSSNVATGYGTSDSRIKPSYVGDMQAYNESKGIENEYVADFMYSQGMEKGNLTNQYNEEWLKAANKSATEWRIYWITVMGGSIALLLWLL